MGKTWFALALALSMLITVGCGPVASQESSVHTPASGEDESDISTTRTSTSSSSTTNPSSGTTTKTVSKVNVLAKVKLPTMVAYDRETYSEWQQSVRAQQAKLGDSHNGMTGFYQRTIKEFLGKASDDNRVYSPINVYMALSMLAETTAGDSRQQILDLLGVSDLDTLRKKTAALWNGNFRDDGAVVTRLANSLWLSDGLTYNDTAPKNLASHHYASVYSGRMGSAEYTAALQDWLDENTGGLLKKQTKDAKLDANTVAALASTLYFRARWDSSFSTEATAPGVFHAAKGNKTVDFMHKTARDFLYSGDGFTAIKREMSNGDYAMWYVLPNEGVPVERLAGDAGVLALLDAPNAWKNKMIYKIDMTLPKLDVSSMANLIPGLKNLGVTAIFSSGTADFSPLSPDKGVYVTGASHSARFTADEEGCEGAAITLVTMAKSAYMNLETVSFTADRPFFFAVTGVGGTLLFTGVVEDPAA